MENEGRKAVPEGASGGSFVNELTPERIERNQRVFADIVAKYYGDPDFKARVDADPTGVIRAEGLEVPEGAEVRLLFNTDSLLHIVLPYKGDGRSTGGAS